MLEFEDAYRKPGNTLLGQLFGVDAFDFWVGRFYVGLFGVIAAVAIALGVAVLFIAVGLYGDWDLVRANIGAPLREYGLGPAPFMHGGAWQAVVVLATISFVAWALREVEICKKLEGFDLSYSGHLTWVSNTGFRYMNFYLNPFHAYAVLGFFLTAMVLAMHGSAILGTYHTDKDPNVEMLREDNFWRDYIGYSIGEYGIHRLGFYLAFYTLIMSDLCILTSGTLVSDWVKFWHPF